MKLEDLGDDAEKVLDELRGKRFFAVYEQPGTITNEGKDSRFVMIASKVSYQEAVHVLGVLSEALGAREVKQ
jgi:hypothetical protein